MTATRAFPLAVVVLLAAACSSPPKKLNLENLMTSKVDEAFKPGVDVVVSRIEVPPGATLERHYHPGEEFVYCLDGSFTVEIEGAEPIERGAGTITHIPYKKLHHATAGPKGARAIVFRIHDHGQPVRILESGKKSDR